MHGKTNTKIFIASSWQLRKDRAAFRELILEQNNAWHEQGAFLQVLGWEYFLDAMSPTRLQDEYNKAIRDCDIFVMLYHTKVGKFTREEFEVALKQFRNTGKPLIYTYCKTIAPKKPPSDEDTQSLAKFTARLEGLEHFKTEYINRKGLQLHFLQQLYRLAGDGVIGFAPPGGALAKGESPPSLVYIHAAEGSAMANGQNAKAAAPGAIIVGDNVSGNHNTGIQTIIEKQTHIDTDGGAIIGGNITVSGGDFIGRDRKGSNSDE